MSITHLLNERCSVYVGTVNDDTEGVGGMNWGTPTTNVPLRFQLLWLSKDFQQYGEKNIAKGIVYFDGDFPLQDRNCAIEVTFGQHIGRKFRIIGVTGVADSNGGNSHWEAFVEETDAKFA